MTRQEQFVAKTKQLIAEAKALRPEARRLIVELLNEARNRIVTQLVGLDPNSFTAAQLQALKLSIDNTMQTFGTQAAAAINQLQTKAGQIGVAMVDKPVEAAFGPLSLGRLSQSTLAIAQGYTADLVTALSKTAAANVNGAIQRAFLGGQPMTQIVEQIGKAIGNGQWDGIFGPIGERAQTIALNEILRVSSIATQARMEGLSEQHPDLQKQWFHIPAARRPRLYHMESSGQVVDVKDPFVIAGEELMYPRDPNGSAWNTINCHCLMRPYFSDGSMKPTSAQSKLLQDLGLQVEVTHTAA
jgi:hypothetical protein